MEFGLAQSMVVTFTGLNAFIMVVKEIKLPLGKYDWRLLLTAFGIPLCFVIVIAGFDYLGPIGPWYVNNIISMY